jgi:hypothetical protein
MRPQFIMAYLFLGAVVISASGCAGLSAGQAWSENYALAPGVQANDPAIIDGNPQTIGLSQYVGETVRGLIAGSDTKAQAKIGEIKLYGFR